MALSFGPLYRDFKKELDKNRQTQQIMRQEQVSGVRPMFKAPEMPQQSTWDKVRDIFDANTDADVYRRFQSGQDNNAPRQSNLDKIRDVFDANTALDRYNRIKAGQSADYVQQQKELGNPNATTSPIPSVLTNFIQGTTKTLGLAGRAGELTPEEAARNQKLFDEGSQTTMQLRPTVAVKGPNGETVYASKNPVTSRNITEQFSTPQNAAEAAYLYGAAGVKAKLMAKNPFGGKTLLGKVAAEGGQNVLFNTADQLTADDKRSIAQKLEDSISQAPAQFAYGAPYAVLPGAAKNAKVSLKTAKDVAKEAVENYDPIRPGFVKISGAADDIADNMKSKAANPKGGFSRAGDSIDMSRYKPTGQTPEQARIADMAKRTGISESTLIREASRRGGIDKIEGVASSLTDDITARSKDAVFTAKLKDTVPVVKQSQKPEVTAKLPVREDVPYDIDPVTGGYRNLQDMIDNAPDAKKVSGIQAQEITGAVVSQVDRGMDAVDNILKARGSSFEDMARAVQQANRNNLPVPAEFKAEYDMVKQLLDRLRGASSKQMGKQEAYLPQFRAQDNPQVQVGKSLVDLVDVEDFGFSAQRKNLIPLEELDYSKEGIKKYATQAMSYKYRDAIDIEALKQRVKQTDGIDLTDVKARDVLKKTKDLAEEANKAAETPGEIQKLKVVDKIEDIAKTKGKQRIDVLQDVSWAKGQVLDSQVLAGNVTVRTKTGKKDSLFNVLGLKRYRDAEGLAKQVLMPAVEGSDDVSKTLSEYIKKTGAPEATHDAMVMRTVRDLQSVESGGKYYIDPKTFSPEEYVQLVLEQKQAILTKFEKNIARETLIDGLETYNLKGKGMRKLIDYHARHMLTDGRYTKTAADKMTNFIVGTYYRGALGYNPASAILNLLELQRVTSLVGIKDGAEAIRKAIADWNITKRYGVHESSYENLVELQKQRGLMEKTSLGKKIENYSGIMKLFEWTERIKDASTLHALEAVYAKKGLTGEALTNAVLNDFNKYAIKGGQFGSVGLYKTKTGRTLGQFMQYPLKDLQITGNMIKKAFGSDITQQRDAQKYLARLLVQRTITYMVLNAAIGTSAEVAFGIFNPVRQSRIDSEASNAEKVVSYIPGGPAIDMLKDIYISYQQAMRQAERTGENVELGDVANKEVKKNLTLFVPGGNQLINKTGIQHLFGDNPASDFFPQGYFGDEKRGYNESTRIGLQGQEKSKARFATPEEGNLLDRAKGAVFGPYSTDEAREYFGSKVGSDIPFIGGAFQGERFSPVSARQQERIEAGGNPRELIAEDRVNQQARKKFFADNPNLKGVYDEMTKVTYNKDTNKYESDIITPEKWAKVYGDSSLKLYDYLKQRAEANNRQFGDPIDPIYQLKDKGQIKTVLELRSTFTGDEKEPEEILKAKSPWYVDFKKAEAAYYDAQSKRAFTEDADYGMSERKKQYLELGKQYPQNTALIQKYYDTKAENPDAAKEFYKANADQLSADFDALKRQKLDWINAKRKLEGAPPISWDAYQNVTFGYEDDEDRVAKSLYFKNGSGYGGSRQVSMKAPETYGTELRAGVTIKKQPVKKLAQSGKVKKVTIAKPKVSMKKSKV